MSFETITRKYLLDFQKLIKDTNRGGIKSNELLSRPLVHRYIEQLTQLFKKETDEIVIHHDTNYTKNDRPDWRFEDPKTFGIYCFGDHKSLTVEKEFSLTKSDKSQIKRYLKLGRPVFVFDGLEFIFFQQEIDNSKREKLIPKPLDIKDDWSTYPVNPIVEIEFRNLFNNPGYRKWNESDLIEQLATRARNLSEEIKDLLHAPIGSGSSENEENLIVALNKLKGIIEQHHDPSLSEESSCADFIAQVLTFGLFYAHTRNSVKEETPTERRIIIQNFWDSSVIDEISKKLRPFKSILDHLPDIAKNQNIIANWYKEILGVLAHAEFMGTNNSELDFHTLFEKFLARFDPKIRFDRGAFYTPSFLSNWTIDFTQKLCEKHFSNNIFEIADQIIDPCCGTGSFLEALYRKGDIHSKCKLVGLEILPAPYALAHYRLSEIERKTKKDFNVEILLTDTLSDSLMEDIKNSNNGFLKEKEIALNTFKKPIKIVIGNPPSSNSSVLSAAPRSNIETLLNDFRPPKSELSNRQNIQKALNNEAYRFLRWCCEKILKNGEGIVSLILPSTFIRSISFKNARNWLTKNFNNLYVFEIDNDARTNAKTQSIFSVMQGRIVLFCVKTSKPPICKSIAYGNIANKSLPEKKKFLKTPVDLKSMRKVEIKTDNYYFAPSKEYPEKKWEKYWPLINSEKEGIFKMKCSAIKLAPSAIMFHTSEAILIRRTNELARTKTTKNDIIKHWFSGQKRPPSSSKLTQEVKTNLLRAVNSKNISNYNFRPFVFGKVLNDEELFEALVNAPGGGTRSRPELRNAFKEGAVGISFAPSTIDLGSSLSRFSSFTWALPDNDIVARGNAMIYCNFFSEQNNRGNFDLSSNLNPKIKSLFSFSEDPETATLFYVYAISSSSCFLETFEGILYGPSRPKSPTRIPFSADIKIRKDLVILGERLAMLEKPEYSIINSNSFLIQGKNDKTIQLKSFSYNQDKKTITLKGEEGTIIIGNVLENIFRLKISGHFIVEKWLREKTFPYYRKNFGVNELEELINLLSRIEEQDNLITKKINPIVDEIIKTDTLIMPESFKS